MTQGRVGAAILLMLVGAGLSGLLLLEHHGVAFAESAVEGLCGEGSGSGCEQISQSRYATVGPISLAGLGLVFYASLTLLLALALLAGEPTGRTLSGLACGLLALALVMDLALLAIQAFSIGAFCALCIATYVVNLVALAILFPARDAITRVPGLPSQSEGRLAMGGWLVGSTMTLMMIVAVELALAQVHGVQETYLLGTPPPASAGLDAPPSPSETSTESASVDPAAAEGGESETSASEAEEIEIEDADPPSSAVAARVTELEEQVRQARAEATRLQGILDDPQKFEEYQAEKSVEEFERAERQTLDLERIPFKGPAEAPIRVVEFSDFLCPYCRSLAGAFANYLPQSGGRVAIYFKNYPLDRDCNPELSRTVHPGACELALGGVCAAAQERFWPYHDQVFSAAPEVPGRADVVRLAAAAGLDEARFKECLESEGAREQLAAEIREARRLEVSGTPTVFINGKRLSRLNDFLHAIASESTRLGLPAPPSMEQ